MLNGLGHLIQQDYDCVLLYGLHYCVDIVHLDCLCLPPVFKEGKHMSKD